MTIKFKKDCTYKGKYYFKDDILEDLKDLESIWKLNENGFIYPITYKEYLKFKNEKGKIKVEKNETSV